MFADTLYESQFKYFNCIMITVSLSFNFIQCLVALFSGCEKASGFQVFVNNLVWDSGCTQVISGPTRGDALLNIYPRRLERSLISSNILPGISDHNGV
jgi:hypothetical protein